LYFTLIIFLFSLAPGKSLVSESKDEVQASETGGRRVGFTTEKERNSSHKPMENGHKTRKPWGNWRHLRRLKDLNCSNTGQRRGLKDVTDKDAVY